MSEAAQGDGSAQASVEGERGSVSVPPYIPFQTLLTFLSELKTNGLPPQVDKSVLKRFSGGVQGQLMSAVRSLGLLDGAKPTPALVSLVNDFETPDFEKSLLDLLHKNYSYVFALDLMSATPTMFADAFKVTGAKEDVARKCRTFFLHAAKQAGVPLGNRILTGSVPRAAANTTPRKKIKAPKVEEPIVEPKRDPPPAPAKEQGAGAQHPLVAGLLLTLPAPGKPWPIEARASWLRMAGSIFENIYQGKGTVDVRVTPASKETAADQ